MGPVELSVRKKGCKLKQSTALARSSSVVLLMWECMGITKELVQIMSTYPQCFSFSSLADKELRTNFRNAPQMTLKSTSNSMTTGGFTTLKIQVPVLQLPLTSCVTRGMQLHLSEPLFFQQQMSIKPFCLLVLDFIRGYGQVPATGLACINQQGNVNSVLSFCQEKKGGDRPFLPPPSPPLT